MAKLAPLNVVEQWLDFESLRWEGWYKKKWRCTLCWGFSRDDRVLGHRGNWKRFLFCWGHGVHTSLKKKFEWRKHIAPDAKQLVGDNYSPTGTTTKIQVPESAFIAAASIWMATSSAKGSDVTLKPLTSTRAVSKYPEPSTVLGISCPFLESSHEGDIFNYPADLHQGDGWRHPKSLWPCFLKERRVPQIQELFSVSSTSREYPHLRSENVCSC